MRGFWLAAAISAASMAYAQDEPVSPEPGQDKLVMVSAPTARDDAKYFPNGAPVSGRVLIRCSLTDKGAVTDCALVRETPSGGGLATVALQEVNLYRFKPMDREGQPVVGRKVVLAQSYLARGDANPDWVRRPTPYDIASVYPAKALKERKNGEAVIACVVTVTGALDRCRSDEESPEGYGFGDAAVMLSTQFMMTPKIRGGVAVSGAVRIPIHFKWAGANPVATEVVVADPSWAKVPSAAQVKAAYPTGARASEVPMGQVALRCHVDDRGGLELCSVSSEFPPGRGFATAARSLLPNFLLRFDPADAALLKRVNVDLPFRFRNPAEPEDSRLTDPRWVGTLSVEGAAALYPEAAVKAGVKSGVGFVDCMATGEGDLTDCKVTREEPSALGFGAAALEASKVMKMNPWSKTGEPVEGRRLLLPIRLQVETLGPADEVPAAPRP